MPPRVRRIKRVQLRVSVHGMGLPSFRDNVVHYHYCDLSFEHDAVWPFKIRGLDRGALWDHERVSPEKRMRGSTEPKTENVREQISIRIDLWLGTGPCQPVTIAGTLSQKTA